MKRISAKRLKEAGFEPWDVFEKELLSNPEVKKEYDRLGPEYEIIYKLIEARIKTGITQKQIAERMGTKQSGIARLESGNANPSIKFLQRLAEALNTKFTFQIG